MLIMQYVCTVQTIGGQRDTSGHIWQTRDHFMILERLFRRPTGRRGTRGYSSSLRVSRLVEFLAALDGFWHDGRW